MVCDGGGASTGDTRGHVSVRGVERVTSIKSKPLITSAASGRLPLSEVIDSNITVLPHTDTHTQTHKHTHTHTLYCPLIYHLK